MPAEVNGSLLFLASEVAADLFFLLQVDQPLPGVKRGCPASVWPKVTFYPGTSESPWPAGLPPPPPQGFSTVLPGRYDR